MQADSSTVASGTPERQLRMPQCHLGRQAVTPAARREHGFGDRRKGQNLGGGSQFTASRGMPKTTQVASSWAMVRAPAWRIFSSPWAPSIPCR